MGANYSCPKLQTSCFGWRPTHFTWRKLRKAKGESIIKLREDGTVSIEKLTEDSDVFRNYILRNRSIFGKERRPSTPPVPRLPSSRSFDMADVGQQEATVPPGCFTPTRSAVRNFRPGVPTPLKKNTSSEFTTVSLSSPNLLEEDSLKNMPFEPNPLRRYRCMPSLATTEQSSLLTRNSLPDFLEPDGVQDGGGFENDGVDQWRSRLATIKRTLEPDRDVDPGIQGAKNSNVTQTPMTV